MHRDTVIGIVGAAVLVAVMVAVFVYEYNQGTADGGDGGRDPDAQFADRYIGLNASEDLDADGIPNALDDDFDGDGIDNGNDTAANASFDLTGSVGAGPNAAPATNTFFAGTGAVHVMGWVNYTLPAPAPIGSAFALQARLLDANGELAATATAQTAPGQTQVSLELDVEDVVPGNYTLEVRRLNQAGAAPSATAYTGHFQVHYHYESPDIPLEK